MDNKKVTARKSKPVANAFAQIIKKKLKDHLRKIILFGSHARGDYHQGSDYDFLVVVDRKEKYIREAVLDAGVEIMDKYYELVGCIVCDEKEWEFKKRFPIGLNILKEGIEL